MIVYLLPPPRCPRSMPSLGRREGKLDPISQGTMELEFITLASVIDPRAAVESLYKSGTTKAKALKAAT